MRTIFFRDHSNALGFKREAERMGWTVSSIDRAEHGWMVTTNCPFNL